LRPAAFHWGMPAALLPPGRNRGHPRTAPIGLSRIRKTGVEAGAELSVVALGKRAQMPYVWLPRRDPTRTAERRKPAASIGATADWWQFLTRNTSVTVLAGATIEALLHWRLQESSRGTAAVKPRSPPWQRAER
jgi:hypothetical protein